MLSPPSPGVRFPCSLQLCHISLEVAAQDRIVQGVQSDLEAEACATTKSLFQLPFFPPLVLEWLCLGTDYTGQNCGTAGRDSGKCVCVGWDWDCCLLISPGLPGSLLLLSVNMVAQTPSMRQLIITFVQWKEIVLFSGENIDKAFLYSFLWHHLQK